MRKILVLVFLIVVTAFSVFAANSASDFSYKLSDDVEFIIWNFRNTRSKNLQLSSRCCILLVQNFNDKEFALRDLMGGENFEWTGTPLYSLWEKHKKLRADNPVKSAGIDAGWILKKVILNDKRKFELRKSEMTNKYRWIK